MLASSSHMERAGKLGGDLQNFGKRIVWEGAIESLVDVLQRHAVGEAFQYEGDCPLPQPRHPAQRLGQFHGPKNRSRHGFGGGRSQHVDIA